MQKQLSWHFSHMYFGLPASITERLLSVVNFLLEIVCFWCHVISYAKRSQKTKLN